MIGAIAAGLSTLEPDLDLLTMEGLINRGESVCTDRLYGDFLATEGLHLGPDSIASISTCMDRLKEGAVSSVVYNRPVLRAYRKQNLWLKAYHIGDDIRSFPQAGMTAIDCPIKTQLRWALGTTLEDTYVMDKLQEKWFGTLKKQRNSAEEPMIVPLFVVTMLWYTLFFSLQFLSANSLNGTWLGDMRDAMPFSEFIFGTKEEKQDWLDFRSEEVWFRQWARSDDSPETERDSNTSGDLDGSIVICEESPAIRKGANSVLQESQDQDAIISVPVKSVHAQHAKSHFFLMMCMT